MDWAPPRRRKQAAAAADAESACPSSSAPRRSSRLPCRIESSPMLKCVYVHADSAPRSTCHAHVVAAAMQLVPGGEHNRRGCAGSGDTRDTAAAIPPRRMTLPAAPSPEAPLHTYQITSHETRIARLSPPLPPPFLKWLRGSSSVEPSQEGQREAGPKFQELHLSPSTKGPCAPVAVARRATAAEYRGVVAV